MLNTQQVVRAAKSPYQVFEIKSFPSISNCGHKPAKVLEKKNCPASDWITIVKWKFVEISLFFLSTFQQQKVRAHSYVGFVSHTRSIVRFSPKILYKLWRFQFLEYWTSDCKFNCVLMRSLKHISLCLGLLLDLKS